jgi:hypothetical protein
LLTLLEAGSSIRSSSIDLVSIEGPLSHIMVNGITMVGAHARGRDHMADRKPERFRGQAHAFVTTLSLQLTCVS